MSILKHPDLQAMLHQDTDAAALAAGLGEEPDPAAIILMTSSGTGTFAEHHRAHILKINYHQKQCHC